MNNCLVFVAGIHGVGKTTACSKYATRSDIYFTSASNIIKTRQECLVNKEKIVTNVASNQEHLLNGLHELKQKYKTILLDGHFTLLDTNRNVTKIPTETFNSIGISICIVIIDKPEDIYKRLTERGNTNLSKELLSTMQKAEITHAEDVCETLGIPLHIINYAEIADSKIFSDIVSAYI